MRAFFRQLLAAALLLHVVGLPIRGADEAKKDAPKVPAPIELPGIHNAFRVTDRVYSGSQPEGDAAFAELARLGVKTIVSVDGGKPNLELARKHGLRYVHLPFGYDSIPAERAAQLEQAARTISGPIYLHCHHGKHRGPAAVGIICETTEGWTPERAEAWLQQAGTAPDYPGLYRAVREFNPFAPERLSRLGPLPEITKTGALVDAMVAIDERFDVLKAMQKAGWKASAGEADRGAAHEATLLWEHFRELARTDDTAQRSNDYRARLADAERAADDLRNALRSATPELSAVEVVFKRSTESCAACHKAFRNVKK